MVSSDSSAFVLTSNDPDFFDPKDVHGSKSGLDLSDDEMEVDSDMDDFQFSATMRRKTVEGKAKVLNGTKKYCGKTVI